MIDPLPAGLSTLPEDDVVETVAVSAEKLGISGSTLRRLIASGSGPSARRIGITRGDRRAWLERCKEPASAAVAPPSRPTD